MDQAYEQLSYQPCSLSEHDIEYPEEYLHNFFYDYPLHKARSHLWEIFKGWTYNEAVVGFADDIEGMMLFHEHLKKMIEIAFVIFIKYQKSNNEKKCGVTHDK